MRVWKQEPLGSQEGPTEEKKKSTQYENRLRTTRQLRRLGGQRRGDGCIALHLLETARPVEKMVFHRNDAQSRLYNICSRGARVSRLGRC
jgi:hypothetical protein